MSAMKIHGSEYTINKVFSDDFAFEIPHYQRPYSWSIEHASELLSDLLATLGDGDDPIDEAPPYFLGCIVLIKPDGTIDSKVVDGQQRLTTLTILMAALREAIEDKSAADDLTQFLYAKGTLAAEVLRRGGLSMDAKTIDNALLQHVARPLAEKFKVSAEAMMYRLEALDLLQRKSEPRLF